MPATNLQPFDPVALRDTVDATAKELMLPGTMVLLRTPQGELVFGYGATELGGTTPLKRARPGLTKYTPDRGQLTRYSS